MRRDPETGKEYLVADGTTWVVGGKVFGNQFQTFILVFDNLLFCRML